MTKYYKAFRKDGLTLHGRPAWPKPTDDGPGEWLPALEGEPRACEHGYHLMREQDLPYWPGWHLYEVEIDGDAVESDNKVVTTARCRLVRKLAWGETELLPWLADCAEHVLSRFEQRHPEDSRPRRCIGALREYTAGRIPKEQLNDAAAAAYASAASAAYASAASAAYAAAASAAYAAAYAADAAAYAADAAAYAADDAAAAAASAAYAAAYAAERQWQCQRMLKIAGVR